MSEEWIGYLYFKDKRSISHKWSIIVVKLMCTLVPTLVNEYACTVQCHILLGPYSTIGWNSLCAHLSQLWIMWKMLFSDCLSCTLGWGVILYFYRMLLKWCGYCKCIPICRINTLPKSENTVIVWIETNCT